MVFHPRVVDDGSFLAALWFEGKPGQFYCAESHRQAQNLAVAGVRGASVEFLRTHYPELRNVTHLHRRPGAGVSLAPPAVKRRGCLAVGCTGNDREACRGRDRDQHDRPHPSECGGLGRRRGVRLEDVADDLLSCVVNHVGSSNDLIALTGK